MPPLHPDLAPYSFLLGTWTGRGRGEYPTIDPFEYLETIEFSHVGKPFLAYAQRTRSVGEPPSPMHAETGYWRFPSDGQVELVLAHPTGVTEIEQGSVTLGEQGAVIDVASTTIGLTTSAKQVTALSRRFEITGETMSYRLDMGAVGQPIQFHLEATLTRVTPVL